MADFWSNIWNVIWLFFWIFAVLVYLMAMFNVIIDLFRDSSLNGWFKAIWIIFLVFLPFLTVLVYLIARGRGMAERRQAEVARAHESANQYIREVAGSSTADEIHKAKALLDSGAIDASEFAALKAKALS
ncbi:SHOCT domain-containing protein [Homoserinimonas sp. OAct 916]|uniref:SHOCT domain-containing protein n=1 Tax=Homoserinimonas sp. OAct 916 TaxID=2211450 RepID=UPI000DBE36B5|nr:SHOCT domain-containing protein [Homoserinimonas sp. OAct 916]